MMSEACALLARLNLVGSIAILAVLAMRRPARWAFGPEVAYRLWAAPLWVVGASLLPARVMEHAPDPVSLAPLFGRVAPGLLAAWLAGVAVVAALLCRAQLRFLRQASVGHAGPAVVGVFAPRIIMPPDDGRFTPEERQLVRAHERAHIDRRDPRAGAWIAVAQCLSWFNPLVHLAAHLARLDQELACDAAVVRRHPAARALYARTLLKTQLASVGAPLCCLWPARGAHPLEVRVALLKSHRRGDSLFGAGLTGLLLVCGGVAAWAVQPPVPAAQVIAGEDILDDQPTMSVMLVSAPRRAAAAIHGR